MNIIKVFEFFGEIGIKTQQAEEGLKNVRDNAKTSAENIVDTFKKVAGVLGTIFAVDKVIDFSKMAIEASATSQALNSQFSQVFGDMEDQAREGMNRVAQEVGSLPNRLLPAFNQISSFAKVNGMETSEALSFTERAMVAAADSAAWYDKSIEETTNTLQSYLKGNYEVADNLGILSTETTRNATATKLFGDEYKNLSGLQQQEVLLAMYEEANQLSGAMGQASREADGWENVMGNLKQSWQDFLAVVGAPLLKAVIPIVQGITNWVVKLAKALEDGNPTLDVMREIFEAIGEVLQDVFVDTMEVLNELWTEFSDLMESVDWTGIYHSIKDVIDRGLKFFEPILTAINRVIQAQIEYWKGLFNAIKLIFNGDWQGAWETLKTTFVTAITSIADALYDGFMGMFDNVKELIVNIDWWGVGQNVMSALGSAISNGIEWLGDIGAEIKTWISEQLGLGADGSWSDIGNKIWTNIKAGADSAISSAENIADSIKTWILDKLGLDDDSSWLEIARTILDNIASSVTQATESAVTFLFNLLDTLNAQAPDNEQVDAIVTKILGALAGAIGGLAVATLEILKAIITGILNAFDSLDTTEWDGISKGILDGIKGALKNVWEFSDTVVDLIEKFATGVGSGDWSPLGDAIKNNVVRVIEEQFKKSFLLGNFIDYDPWLYEESSDTQKGDSKNGRDGGGRDRRQSKAGSGVASRTASLGGAGGTQTPTIDTSAVDKLIAEVNQKISDATSKIEELGRNYTAKLIDGVTKGITTNQSKVTLNLGILGNNMKSELDKNHDKSNKAVTTGMNRIEANYRSMLSRLSSTVRSGLTKVTEAFRSQIASVTRAGEDTGRGFYNGLASQQSRITGLARSIARDVENTIRTALDTRSPSKVGFNIFKDFGQGLYNGLDSMKIKIVKLAENVALGTSQMVRDNLTTSSLAGSVAISPVGSANVYNRELADSMKSMNQKLEWLEQLYFKDTNNYFDSREVSKVILEPLEEERRLLEILKQRRLGR